jgi:hypothetical protein
MSFNGRFNEYLIQGLMPAREVSLIAGSSGVGKTKLTIQMARAILEGKDFLTYRTVRTPSLYVACDRGHDSVLRSLFAYGLKEDSFEWLTEDSIPSQLGRMPRPVQILNYINRKFPQIRFVVLDGFSGLVQDVSDYQEVKSMIRGTQNCCQKFDLTVLGTTHSTKIKTLDKICNPRERVLGSVAWGGYSEMVISLDPEDLEDVTNPFRIAHVCNHSGANLRLRLKFDSSGALVVVNEETDLFDLFALKLGSLPEEGVSREDFGHFIQSSLGQVSERSADRLLARALELGLLRKEGQTRSTRYFLAPLN